jgi:hypothetical protein
VDEQGEQVGGHRPLNLSHTPSQKGHNVPSIEETLAAVLRAEVEKRVAAVQQLADNAVADMQLAIDRLQNATAAPPQNTAVAVQATMQAPPAPLAGQQLAHDDPRLHGSDFEVTNSPIGLVRSGWIATGGSLPLVRES